MRDIIQYTGDNVDEVDAFLGGVEWKTVAPPIAWVKTHKGYVNVYVTNFIQKTDTPGVFAVYDCSNA